MTDTDKTVGITADGLVVVRSGREARILGLHDPFAEWFVTEDGHRLVRMAKEVDPVYEEFNVARYLYTSALLARHAVNYEQMIFLGAGFDCRALSLKELNAGRAKIYEVDTPVKVEQKLARLQQRGVVVPEWNPHIACNLREDRVKILLEEAGFDFGKPALVLAEGLFFYLPAELTTRILRPKWLNLAEGSLVVFDCWGADRVNDLNGKMAKKIGSKLFQPFPCAVEPNALTGELARLGYARSRTTSLEAIAQGYYGRVIEDQYPSSWWMVEATV